MACTAERMRQAGRRHAAQARVQAKSRKDRLRGRCAEMTSVEAAELLGISQTTARRYARELGEQFLNPRATGRSVSEFEDRSDGLSELEIRMARSRWA